MFAAAQNHLLSQFCTVPGVARYAKRFSKLIALKIIIFTIIQLLIIQIQIKNEHFLINYIKNYINCMVKSGEHHVF